MPVKVSLRKKVKVIFLDIDGVLWTPSNEERKRPKYDKIQSSYEQGVEDNVRGEWKTKAYKVTEELDPTCCSNLNWLLKIVPDSVICVSSTWRMGRTTKQLERLLIKNKIYEAKGRVVGKTPKKMTSTRGQEINMWLQSEEINKDFDIESFVILDDSSDMLTAQLNNFVQTDLFIGLTMYDSAKAAFILGERVDEDLLGILKYRSDMFRRRRTLTTFDIESRIDRAVSEFLKAKRNNLDALLASKPSEIQENPTTVQND